MNKELIINAAPQGVEIALLEDRKLVELHKKSPRVVGDLEECGGKCESAALDTCSQAALG